MASTLDSVGVINIPYASSNYSALLDYLETEKRLHPTCSLVTADEFHTIVDFLQADKDGSNKFRKNQFGTANWRNKIRSAKYVLEGKEGEQRVYRLDQTTSTESNPDGRVQLLPLHEIPKALHEVHVNLLGHAGEDKCVAKVGLISAVHQLTHDHHIKRCMSCPQVCNVSAVENAIHWLQHPEDSSEDDLLVRQLWTASAKNHQSPASSHCVHQLLVSGAD